MKPPGGVNDACDTPETLGKIADHPAHLGEVDDICGSKGDTAAALGGQRLQPAKGTDAPRGAVARRGG